MPGFVGRLAPVESERPEVYIDVNGFERTARCAAATGAVGKRTPC
jgi:hypothetical protein